MWIQKIRDAFMEVFKKYKVVPYKNKFLLEIKTGRFWWNFLRWKNSEGHTTGEYCLFNSFKEAKEFGEYWTKNERVPIPKWYKYKK